MKRLIQRLLDVKEYEVWHPESPGMKVVVRRSRIGRLLKPNFFATLWEKNRRPQVKA